MADMTGLCFLVPMEQSGSAQLHVTVKEEGMTSLGNLSSDTF